MGKEMALAQTITAHLPVEFDGKVHSFHFEYDMGRIESIWSDLKRGGGAETCRLWLFAGIHPDQADELRAYLEAPDQTSAEEGMMGELLPFLGKARARIGRFELLF